MAYDIVIGRSKHDLEKLGTEGTIFIGKHYVKMGRTTSLSNPVYLDMVRSHVVFVCGKRGGGKCLTGDARITLANGEVVAIKDFERRRDHLLSLNDDLKISQQAVDAFYKRQVQTLLKIRLRTGKKLSLTPEHPLLTVSGWQEARSLPVGSRIATPRVEPAFGERALPEHEVKILAYLLAEGHLGNNQILFSNIDPDILNDFTLAIRKYDRTLSVVEHSKKGCYRIIGRKPKSILTRSAQDERGRFTNETRIDNRSEMRKWLESHQMYGTLAKERRLPPAIYSLPKHQLSLFLNRLFSCDGSIYKEGAHTWKVSYSSASKDFIEAISHLLLRFGVVSMLREKRNNRFESFELEIKGEFVNIFLQEIGFFAAKERKAALALRESIRIIRNPNVDTIPREVWDSFDPDNWAESGRRIGYTHPKALRESTRYSPCRQKLLQIALADQNQLLEKLATSDIYWDEIIAIEEIEGDFTVYDLTVPTTHNFIANDIIVHNSYTMGVIAEGMADLPPHIRKNISIVMLDTMGIYWTMKYPNMKEKELLERWEQKPHPLDITIYTPKGFYNRFKDEGIPTDKAFSIRPSELQGSDWTTTFGLDPNDAVGVLIERTVHGLREAGKDDYAVQDLIDALMADPDAEKATKLAAKNHFEAAKAWGIFDAEGTPLSELAAPGQVSVLDVSCYVTEENGWAIKALVIGLVAQKLFTHRMLARKDEEFKDVERQTSYFADDVIEEQEYPLVWLVIDEAHEFMPQEGKTLATDPLVTILRAGRQPGISLILATQQPGKIHTDVMTQSDTIIAHRITAKIDTDALGTLMQSYMRTGLDRELDDLPRTTGAALILDDNNEKMYPIQIRPRFTWHGGESPTALKKQKKLFGF